MDELTTFEELAAVFSDTVGVEKARDVVSTAAEDIGIGRKDQYATTEVVEICERIEDANDGYVEMVARDLQIRTQAEQRFHGLLENIPDPAVVVDFSGVTPAVQAVNTAFEDVFGYEESDLAGDPLNEYIVPEDARAEAEAIDRQTMAGERVEREVRRKTADGELRDFLFRATTVETASGSLEGYGVYTDITERRERERELERQNEQLDRFASVVSHDLRNPLNVAEARVELTQQTGDLDHLNDVADAHEQMEALIDDLLTLARQGQTIGDLQQVDLEAHVGQAWTSVETRSATLELADDLGTVEADPERLAELLANFFTNAVDHVGSEVTVRVGSLPDGFYVADDGPGIPEADREQVLEHGYTTADEGTGFGLSIVRSIIEAHDWTVEVTESADGGARFEITGVGQ